MKVPQPIAGSPHPFLHHEGETNKTFEDGGEDPQVRFSQISHYATQNRHGSNLRAEIISEMKHDSRSPRVEEVVIEPRFGSMVGWERHGYSEMMKPEVRKQNTLQTVGKGDNRE